MVIDFSVNCISKLTVANFQLPNIDQSRTFSGMGLWGATNLIQAERRRDESRKWTRSQAYVNLSGYEWWEHWQRACWQRWPSICLSLESHISSLDQLLPKPAVRLSVWNFLTKSFLEILLFPVSCIFLLLKKNLSTFSSSFLKIEAFVIPCMSENVLILSSYLIGSLAGYFKIGNNLENFNSIVCFFSFQCWCWSFSY